MHSVDVDLEQFVVDRVDDLPDPVLALRAIVSISILNPVSPEISQTSPHGGCCDNWFAFRTPDSNIICERYPKRLAKLRVHLCRVCDRREDQGDVRTTPRSLRSVALVRIGSPHGRPVDSLMMRLSPRLMA